MYKPFLLDAIKRAKTPPHRVGKVTRFNRVVEHAANEYIREHYHRKCIVGCEHTAIHYGLPIGGVYHDKLYLLGMGTQKGRVIWTQVYKGMRIELRRMIENGEVELVGV